MSIWELYRKPDTFTGRPLGEFNARYYTGLEGSKIEDNLTWGYLAGTYFLALGTYFYCTFYGMRSQRLLSSLTLTAVPLTILVRQRGENSKTSLVTQISLEERLDYYPITRRALERAIEDISKH